MSEYEDLAKVRYELVETVEEFQEPWFFLGFARAEGERWTLIGVTEEQADKLIEEFKATGRITIGLQHLQSSEVIEPVAVSKLRGDSLFYKIKKAKEVKGE